MAALSQKTEYDMEAQRLLLQRQDALRHVIHYAREFASSSRSVFAFLSLGRIYLCTYLKSSAVFLIRHWLATRLYPRKTERCAFESPLVEPVTSNVELTGEGPHGRSPG